jgi:cellobiose phosphorylase
LLVDPCIPNDWKGFKVSRKFRGAEYIIEVQNPNGVSKGVKEIFIDGQSQASNLIPLFEDGEEHSVIVIMG